jgi:hypothetical protein
VSSDTCAALSYSSQSLVLVKAQQTKYCAHISFNLKAPLDARFADALAGRCSKLKRAHAYVVLAILLMRLALRALRFLLLHN